MAGNGRGRTTLELVGLNADASFYVQRAAAHPGPVLVLGGGNGRIAWALAESGARILSVDPSALMVEYAEQRRASGPPEVASRASFLHADLRALRLSERFALVLAPQNAPGLMSTPEDLDALFATVRHHLADGGAFLFDMLNPAGPHGPGPWQAEEDPAGPLPPLRPVFVPHLRERSRSRGGQATGGLHRLRLRQFSPEELDQALGRAGLEALERYGDFMGKPFSREDPVQVVVAAARTAD
jgi:SAM-dependent methyltransferase